jgi:hypothetical protein
MCFLSTWPCRRVIENNDSTDVERTSNNMQAQSLRSYDGVAAPIRAARLQVSATTLKVSRVHLFVDSLCSIIPLALLQLAPPIAPVARTQPD